MPLPAESNISIRMRDVDGDNQPDLIFFGTDTNRTAAIWLNRGSGEPAREHWFPEPDITPLMSEGNGKPFATYYIC